ncbi:MAG: pectate lyase [Hyphomonadaceae bacterium]|nr:pectate lyase [Hyphomonadaceae bacterium]
MRRALLSRRAVLHAPAALAAAAPAFAQTPAQLAFPGALGWAARTPGGRGGAIVRVTTLAAEGPGSLDAALRLRGPRIVVFEVGGVIDLAMRMLTIRNPFVTLAGQTAPSPGITLIRGGLRIRTHDVVVRHIAVRPGDAGQAPRSGWEVDGIVAEAGSHDVIVDHCSVTWATDENLSASGPRFAGETLEEWRAATAHRITFSRNIIAEGLSNATHSKGEHSKGSLIHDNVRDVLIWGNLYASNRERNPLFKGGAGGAVVNNLMVNPGRRFLHYNLNAEEWGDHPYARGSLSVVGNEFRSGPSSPRNAAAIALGGAGPLDLFAADNRLTGPNPPQAFARFGEANPECVDLPAPAIWPEALRAAAAVDVAEAVLANAGARPWDRDPIDARIVAEARAGEGRIIDSQAAVGGYPVRASTAATFDPAEWDLATLERLP